MPGVSKKKLGLNPKYLSTPADRERARVESFTKKAQARSSAARKKRTTKKKPAKAVKSKSAKAASLRKSAIDATGGAGTGLRALMKVLNRKKED